MRIPLVGWSIQTDELVIVVVVVMVEKLRIPFVGCSTQTEELELVIVVVNEVVDVVVESEVGMGGSIHSVEFDALAASLGGPNEIRLSGLAVVVMLSDMIPFLIPPAEE